MNTTTEDTSSESLLYIKNAVDTYINDCYVPDDPFI